MAATISAYFTRMVDNSGSVTSATVRSARSASRSRNVRAPDVDFECVYCHWLKSRREDADLTGYTRTLILFYFKSLAKHPHQ
ncbi:hypothetical protein M404DRAFT_995228 [Pisolithus tinctorius Marx 270]|uniref:Uncharacterized protein n=1 Tax=Pisolithus tinctorius Marx 270 TaxID=870435 RepID=A0A0C3KMC8_PISTI|nr:hypothetical protein M404DRAFT_995228 [Pisolithus tinctorius Marx 270]